MEVQFVRIKQEKPIVKFVEDLLFVLNIIKKNPVARNAKAPQFANTTKDVQFVYNVEVNLFANTVVSNQLARNVKELVYVNTTNYVQIVKHARGHLFVFMKKTKDYVNHAGVLDYVKPNIVKQKLQKNIMDIVYLVVSKCALK